ncbi:MAG TPA: DUF397 domain-containing protein [Mycobacteriales bacterium]|nr:DUF397 domain-containing protein [Mycobacteriales bacterium]
MSVHVTGWRRSSYSVSGGGNCVEVGVVADGTGQVAVRDSKNRTGAVLVYGEAQWQAFVTAVREGCFDH